MSRLSVTSENGGALHSQPHEVPWHVERSGDVVSLSGTFRTPAASAIVGAVRDLTKGAGTVELDLGGVKQIDGGVIVLLLDDLESCGVDAQLRSAERFQPLFDLYTHGCPAPRRKPRSEGIAAQLGRRVLHRVDEFDLLLGFIGELTASIGRVFHGPRRTNWRSVPLLVELSGMDALPVILVLNFLIGFVMAYMSARALALFGANLFVADLVAIAMTRQLAPLMTAIIVCGRSGAAIAAELGSMKVSEEIDALRTLGLDPFGWLVIPRIVALVLVMPVLTILADLVGLLGGLLVGSTSLGITPVGYFIETRETLVAWDVASGLWMSLAFAITIGFIACQQGLAASGGAQGVGSRTTKTVVYSLFAIVLLDAVFTIFYRALGLS